MNINGIHFHVMTIKIRKNPPIPQRHGRAHKGLPSRLMKIAHQRDAPVHPGNVATEVSVRVIKIRYWLLYDFSRKKKLPPLEKKYQNNAVGLYWRYCQRFVSFAAAFCARPSSYAYWIQIIILISTINPADAASIKERAKKTPPPARPKITIKHKNDVCWGVIFLFHAATTPF